LRRRLRWRALSAALPRGLRYRALSAACAPRGQDATTRGSADNAQSADNAR